MSDNRFDRQIRLFGKEGQAKIEAARVAVVGIGGLGSHVVQQLALLGVRHLALIDSQELDETNLNRFIGARFDDPIPGSRKVDIGERMARVGVIARGLAWQSDALSPIAGIEVVRLLKELSYFKDARVLHARP